MADMTLEQALKLADQDCPLPVLAGEALKILRSHIHELKNLAPRDIVYPDCTKPGCRIKGFFPCGNIYCQKQSSAFGETSK